MAVAFINTRRWRIIRFYCIGWTLAFVFLSIVRGVGTTELGSLKFDFLSSLSISITLGPVIGLISGFAQILTEERVQKYRSLITLLIFRMIYGILFLMLLVLGAYVVYQFYFGTSLGIVAFAIDAGSGAIYFYVLSVDVFLTFLRQINLMLGEGNLKKLVQGKFLVPREEERIFMFLDLQSSTQLAEQLGHVNYSLLIQDCFNDLGNAIANNPAEIYQYVGDEAVLTWSLMSGIKNENGLKSFFNFKMTLEKKRDYYEKKYGVLPFFKAGMHSGMVTVTEVGKYKKEIAYHGDTLNTAARIQGQCNVLESELLISEILADNFNSDAYTFTAMGSISLKGKEEKVALFAVSQK
ncbi:adenylate/guanylate cyclase domain-containing protein [Muricauda sp. CAU 1633]|uniref:adenylate/guanylate cyclase domain-containing protein n=1 Tax=Allomuricauda sp. CAU 1633 TaxID=2816036 RepID=UPI001A8D050D|nr:adenylate/guanylate cyclase domain-containing protein [Muricauda sp. CAU 1633]MBO0321602.1 adenylate/guanylate cyclase domain-containing protein [Muricauda sp. CAU 1633]